MERQLRPHAAFPLLLLIGLSLLAGIVRADPKDTGKKGALKPEGSVTGLMTDFKNDYMLVQLDDQDEPTKFLFGPGITIPVLTKHFIFPVDRITLKYKTEGEDKKVLDVVKVPGQKNGIVIGKAIRVYNNFWVSVKPDDGGMIEGFALNGDAAKEGKAVSDILKSLNPGDRVAIKYATDFERHRILKIDVRPAKAK